MHAVAFAIKRAHLRTTGALRTCARAFGLTPARYDMLYAIFTGKAGWQKDLWRIFDVSRATVSRMLISLERLGLVHRTRSRHRASRMVSLTKEGERIMTEAIRGSHRPLCRLFERHCAPERRRRDRVLDVEDLELRVLAVASFFGDRSRFQYPYGHPDG